MDFIEVGPQEGKAQWHGGIGGRIEENAWVIREEGEGVWDRLPRWVRMIWHKIDAITKMIGRCRASAIRVCSAPSKALRVFSANQVDVRVQT